MNWLVKNIVATDSIPRYVYSSSLLIHKTFIFKKKTNVIIAIQCASVTVHFYLYISFKIPGMHC